MTTIISTTMGFGPISAPLEHPLPSTKRFDSGYLTTDQNLGGYATFIVNSDGIFTFSGHAHDSGVENLHYTMTAVLVTPQGKAFTMQHKGLLEGAAPGIIRMFRDPRRDDDFSLVGVNSKMAEDWPDLVHATFKADLKGMDVDAESAVTDLLNAVSGAMGISAAKAEIIPILHLPVD